MKNLRYIFIIQSLRLGAVFLIISISAHASVMQRRMSQPAEPGYHCNNQIYLFSDIETVRQKACKAFTYPRKESRRPLVNTYSDNVENWIFEWSIPACLAKYSKGVNRATPDKITFNNSCELTGVLSYDSASSKYNLCAKVPEVSTSASSRMNQDPVKSFIQCGSLSLEIIEIQRYASAQSTRFMEGFVEVENSSFEVDGPWRRNVLGKIVSVHNRLHNIYYEVMINNQNEVRGMVVTHYIRSVGPAAAKCNDNKHDLLHMKKHRENRCIRLVCIFNTKFELFPNRLALIPSISRKRKTLK